MTNSNEVKLNPELRQQSDPFLGQFAPTDTQLFYKLIVGQSKLIRGQKGVFSQEHIRSGSIIFIGGGQLTSDLANAPKDKDYAGVFDETLYIAPLDFNAPSINWFINHSCEPNLKLCGRLLILAKRDIIEGEELTIDYATVMASDDEWKMSCMCGADSCRTEISNNDWKDKRIFIEHYSEWAPFIQKRGQRLFIDD